MSPPPSTPRFEFIKAIAEELGLPALLELEMHAVRTRPVPDRLLIAIQRGVHADLTPRQRQIMVLFAAGMETREVAAELDISVETVKDHVREIYVKLDVHNRVQAINAFLDSAS